MEIVEDHHADSEEVMVIRDEALIEWEDRDRVDMMRGRSQLH